MTPAEFCRHYTADQRGAIRFEWNGKHSEEFRDSNQDFRFAVVNHILSGQEPVPIVLVRDVVLEQAAWSAKAWGLSSGFDTLLTILLSKRR